MAKHPLQGQFHRRRADSGHRRRILWIAGLLGIAAFIPIGLRLYQLMIRQHDPYLALALNNQTRTTQVSAHRGTIYDCNGNILACSQSVETLYLNPRELKQTGADLSQVSQTLARLTGQSEEKILQKSRDLSLRYQKIADNLDLQTADAIRAYLLESGISGIHLEPASRRVYPYGSLAAQVIGFVNASNSGSEGIEAAWDDYLSGGTDQVLTTKGNHEIDLPFSYEAYLSGQQGSDLTLTLDCTVQSCLENQMQAAITRYDVQNGAFGMVMDVNTGAILAMATLGSYDPNDYLQIADPELAQQLEQRKQQLSPEDPSYEQERAAYLQALQEAQLQQWRNRCISDGYEPGSTFKVLTMAAALDTGAVSLEDHFSCGGSEQIPGRSQLLHCWRSTGHGSQTTAQALENSCNLAFAHIALKLGGERFYEYVEKFGIMEKTGIDLAGESKGVFFSRELITDTDKWGTASLTSGSFGQTFKLTPLQLVRAIAAVVNGGKLVQPYLVSQVTDSRNETLYTHTPQPQRQVIRPETSKTMCALLEGVVSRGTAKNAQVGGFAIGGKTGTSEKIGVVDEHGNPTLDKIVSFVGVAPMDDPRYIILIALDTPSRTTGLYISGGVMAAPVVGAVFADILPYLQVTRSVDSADPAATLTVLQDLTGMDAGQAEAALKEAGLVAVLSGQGEKVLNQLPMAGTAVPGGSQVLLYLSGPEETQPVTVPDFTGMDRGQAHKAAGAAGVSILVSGNTDTAAHVTVTGQDIPGGTQVSPFTAVRLTFTDTRIYD